MSSRHGNAVDQVMDLAVRLRGERQPFALATVIETRGSVSARTGSKAVIDAEGNLMCGWVGGGCAESAVRQAAIDCLANRETEIVDLDLDDEVLGAGMPCGGAMRVFVEPVLPRQRLWVLGNGRVAETLCELGALIGLDVVVDDLQAETRAFPGACQIVTDDLDYSALKPDIHDFVVIATQHRGDHQSMQRALRSGTHYLALIASRKRAGLVMDYLRGQGFADEELARVRAPAGLDLGAQTPEEIALSVISEITMLRRKGSGQAMSATLDEEPRSKEAA
jgi:xanthine dehydrogenase accessory factor